MRVDGTPQFSTVLANTEFVTTSTMPINTWMFATLTQNDSHACIWINGTANAPTCIVKKALTSTPTIFSVNNDVGGGSGLIGEMDEWAFWNRTLQLNEIDDLYNSGAGMGRPSSNIDVTLVSPADETSFLVNENIVFNCSVISNFGNELINVTLYHNATGTFSINQTNTINGTSNSTTFNVPFTQSQTNTWNCLVCDSENTCDWADSNRTFTIGIFKENSKTYNATSYETSGETFILNISSSGSLVTAEFFYGEISQGSSSKTTLTENILFTDSIQVPLVDAVTNKSFYWELEIDGIKSNTTKLNQSVNFINLTSCSNPINTTFLNISFRNETLSQEWVNATFDSTFNYYFGDGSINQTTTFTSSTEYSNYSFCLSPVDKTFNLIYSATYKNSESQQRNVEETIILTNSTTNKVLYLLPTALGIFSPFQTVNSAGDSVNSVTGTITRVLSGNTLTIASALTDSSGFVTYFLNPDASYSASFAKSGLPTNTFSFIPTTDLRIVTMGGGVSGISNGTTIMTNTTYSVRPLESNLTNNTAYVFSLEVNSSQTITLISMNLTNGSGSQLGFNSNAGTGTITINLNTNNETKIIGRYLIQTSEEDISFAKQWQVGEQYIGDYSLFRQMNLYLEYGFRDFMRLLIVIISIMGMLIFLSSGEVTETSESKLAIAVLMIWAFSIVGWLDTGLVSNASSSGIRSFAAVSSQYGIAMVSTSIGLFFILRRVFIRRI